MKMNKQISMAVLFIVSVSQASSAFADASKFQANIVPATAQFKNTAELFGAPPERASRRVAFIGNSITRHGPNAKINWTNDCGMAASSAEKDYVHQCAKLLEKEVPGGSYKLINVADTLERKFMLPGWKPEQYFSNMKAFRPDVVIIFCGANVPKEYDANPGSSARCFGTAVEALARYVGTAKTRYLISEGFYVRPALDAEKKAVAERMGAVFVKMDDIRQRDDTHGRFNHPNDLGMKLIAERFASELKRADGDAPTVYRPELWNLEARKEFANKRFGIFIHWGLYSNFAQGEWYLQYAGLNEAAYSRAMYGFYPSRFDAHEWVKAFKGAGAKYVTVTARHHEGFSLWPTQVDDGYNIGLTPFKRDVLGELAQACRREGLQFNCYYSLMDWHRRDYPAGGCTMKVLGNQKGDYASYKRFMLAQIGELIDRYHPGNIWFDGEWDHAWFQDGKWHRTLDWEFDSIYDFIHLKHVLVANNSRQPMRDREDIQLFERNLPGSGEGFSKNQPVTQNRPIEQCDVLQNSVWGYRIDQKKFRTGDDVCSMIVKSAARDSNLLMNIGPDGSGLLPEKAVEVLGEVGKWMEKNGHAIYGTRGAGLVENADGSITAKTRKGDKVYTFTVRKGQYPVLSE